MFWSINVSIFKIFSLLLRYMQILEINVILYQKPEYNNHMNIYFLHILIRVNGNKLRVILFFNLLLIYKNLRKQ